MSRSSHFDQLRDAVQKELSDEELCANRCDSFLEKIIQYQSGQGALPDEQHFLVWREDLKKALALCALKAGMDLPDQDAPASDDAPTALRQLMLPSRGRYHGSMDSPASGGAPKK